MQLDLFQRGTREFVLLTINAVLNLSHENPKWVFAPDHLYDSLPGGI